MQNTPNFNLPLYEGPDIANLLTGYNQAVTEIDRAMEANKQQSNQNGSKIQQHTGQLNKLNEEMETLENTITTADLPGMQSDINDLKNELKTGAVIDSLVSSNVCRLWKQQNLFFISLYTTINTNSSNINIQNYTVYPSLQGNLSGSTHLWYDGDHGKFTGNLFNFSTNYVAPIGYVMSYKDTTIVTRVIGACYDGSFTYIGMLYSATIDNSTTISGHIPFTEDLIKGTIPRV